MSNSLPKLDRRQTFFAVLGERDIVQKAVGILDIRDLYDAMGDALSRTRRTSVFCVWFALFGKFFRR